MAVESSESSSSSSSSSSDSSDDMQTIDEIRGGLPNLEDEPTTSNYYADIKMINNHIRNIKKTKCIGGKRSRSSSSDEHTGSTVEKRHKKN